VHNLGYIVPDGKLDRTLLVPVWNKNSWNGNFVSLQQGNLYEITEYSQQGSTQFVSTTTKIDSKVQSFVVNLSGGTAQVFDLTADDQVKQYSGSGTTWTTVTDSSTVASTLVSTSYLLETESTLYSIQDGQLYMLAAGKVWQYSGSGTNWNLLTANTTATSIAAADGDLYINDKTVGVIQDVFIHGYLSGGGAVTGSNTAVISIAAAGGTLYMLAINPPDHPLPGVWRYDSSHSTWAAVTDASTFVESIAVAGDVLCMLSLDLRVYQYGLTSDNWFPLTVTNAQAFQILVQDGNQLFMVAAEGSGPVQVWQYSTPGDWTALTGTNTSVKSASVGTDNSLHMVASNNGGKADNWIYDGTPGSWSIVK